MATQIQTDTGTTGNGRGASTGGASHEAATIVKPSLTYQQRSDALKVTPVPWGSAGVALRGALVGILEKCITVTDGMSGAMTADMKADIGTIFDAVEGLKSKWGKLTVQPDPFIRGALCRPKNTEAASANLPTSIQTAGVLVVLSREGMNATVATLGSVGAVHSVSVSFLEKSKAKRTPEVTEQVDRLLATHAAK